VEEAHLADDGKRSNELDPMLASTGGVTWMIGVGCVRLCDFKRGCDVDQSAASTLVDHVGMIDSAHLSQEASRDGPHNVDFRLTPVFVFAKFVDEISESRQRRLGAFQAPLETLINGGIDARGCVVGHLYSP